MRRRRSLRLCDHDYRKNGAYFVTICTHKAICLFGDVIDGAMVINELGEIAREEWLKTASVRTNVELDAYTVMPNHFHGILLILDDEGRATQRVAPTGEYEHVAQNDRSQRRSSTLQSGSLGAIVGQFKSAVTKRSRQMKGLSDLQIWQRGYYDSVLLRERTLNDVRDYIASNPERWFEDSLYVD